MVEVEFRGTHEEIGDQRGRELKHSIRFAMEHWVTPHSRQYPMTTALEYGRRMADDMSRRWPGIMDEVRATARAAGIPEDEFYAYVFRSWNALSLTHGATLACYNMACVDPGRGTLIAGVLEDSPPFYLLETVRPAEGIPYFNVNWAGMPWAVRSMNRAGLAIGQASSFAGTRFREGRHSFPFDLYARAFFAERYALQHADCVDDAVEMILGMETTSVMMLSDKTGRTVILETCGPFHAIREPDPQGILAGGVFESPEMVKSLLDEGIAHDLELGIRRSKQVLSRLKPAVGRTTVEWMADYIRTEETDGGWCRELLQAATIACPSTGEFWAAGFHPCTSGFKKYSTATL